MCRLSLVSKASFQRGLLDCQAEVSRPFFENVSLHGRFVVRVSVNASRCLVFPFPCSAVLLREWTACLQETGDVFHRPSRQQIAGVLFLVSWSSLRNEKTLSWSFSSRICPCCLSPPRRCKLCITVQEKKQENRGEREGELSGGKGTNSWSPVFFRDISTDSDDERARTALYPLKCLDLCCANAFSWRT